MRKKIILSLFFIFQILLVNLLALFPGFIERYYSNGLFPYISKASRIVFGIFGFSIGDIIYFMLIVLLLRWIWQTRKTWKEQYKNNLLTLCSFVSVFYFFFNLLWALNYHRTPLHEKMGISKDYTYDELLAFTKRMIIKANEAHSKIQPDSSQKVTTPFTVQQIYDGAPKGYTALATGFPYFTYTYKSIKSSLISTPLSYMGFGGYLNPFTNEAQVNYNLPKYNLPTTTCHEMAHQIGYASESEANFIGYMASVYNPDPYYQYSGYSFALKYCLRNIAKINKKQAKALRPLIHPGILKNYDESTAFNKKYESFAETFFTAFYDNFLKFNKQEDGLETYSKFTGLLINYYKDKEL